MTKEEFSVLRDAIGSLQEEMRTGFSHMHQKFEQVDKRFEQMDQRFEQMDQRFDRMDLRFDHMDLRFDRMHTEVSAFKSDISKRTEILANFTTASDTSYFRQNERLDQLERRVERLEMDKLK